MKQLVSNHPSGLHFRKKLGFPGYGRIFGSPSPWAHGPPSTATAPIATAPVEIGRGAATAAPPNGLNSG